MDVPDQAEAGGTEESLMLSYWRDSRHLDCSCTSVGSRLSLSTSIPGLSRSKVPMLSGLV